MKIIAFSFWTWEPQFLLWKYPLEAPYWHKREAVMFGFLEDTGEK